MSSSSPQSAGRGRRHLPHQGMRYQTQPRTVHARGETGPRRAPPIPQSTKRPPPPPAETASDDERFDSESSPRDDDTGFEDSSVYTSSEERTVTPYGEGPISQVNQREEDSESLVETTSGEEYENSTESENQVSDGEEEHASAFDEDGKSGGEPPSRLNAAEVYAEEMSHDQGSDLEKQSEERSDYESEAASHSGISPRGPTGQTSVRRGSMHADKPIHQASSRRRAGTFKEDESKFSCKDAMMTFNIGCLSIIQGLLMVPFIMLFNILFVFYIVLFYTIRYWDHGLVTIYETGMIGNNLRVILFIFSLPAYLSLIVYSLLAAILGSIALSFSHPFLTNQTDVREKWHRSTKLSALSSGFRLTTSHLLQLWEGFAEYATVKVFHNMKEWRESIREEPFEVPVADVVLALVFGAIASTILVAITSASVGLKAPFLLGRCFIEVYTRPDYYGGTCGISLKRMKTNPCLLLGYYILATVLAPIIGVAGLIAIILFALWNSLKAAFDIIQSNRSLWKPMGYFSPPVLYCWRTMTKTHEETNRFIKEGNVFSFYVNPSPEEYEGVNVYYLIVGTFIGILGMGIVGVPMVFYWIKMLPMFLARNVYKYFTDFRMFSRPAIQAPLWLFGSIALIPVSLIVWVFLIVYSFFAGFSAGATFYEQRNMKLIFLEMGAIMLRIDQKAVAYIRATDDTYGASGCFYALWRKCGHLVDADELSTDEESAMFVEDDPTGTHAHYTGSAILWNEKGEGRASKRRTLIDEYGYDPAKRLDRKLQAVRGMRALPRGESDNEEPNKQEKQRNTISSKVGEDDSEESETRGCLCLRRCFQSRSSRLSMDGSNEGTGESADDETSLSDSVSSSVEDEENSHVSSSNSISSTEREPTHVDSGGDRMDATQELHDYESGREDQQIDVEGEDAPTRSPLNAEEVQNAEEVNAPHNTDEVDEEAREALERSRRALEQLEEDVNYA